MSTPVIIEHGTLDGSTRRYTIHDIESAKSVVGILLDAINDVKMVNSVNPGIISACDYLVEHLSELIAVLES